MSLGSCRLSHLIKKKSTIYLHTNKKQFKFKNFKNTICNSIPQNEIFQNNITKGMKNLYVKNYKTLIKKHQKHK